MVAINTIDISPPLINTSCAWSSDLQQLEDLYDSPFTGAVTTRTATPDGYKENTTHTVSFAASTVSTLNSYGYSPHPLTSYISWIEKILTSRSGSSKPFIISITASDPESLRSMVHSIQDLRAKVDAIPAGNLGPNKSRIAIELNTSCPNIPNASPSGYSFPSLLPLLRVLAGEYMKDMTLTFGLKLPPFVYREQLLDVVKGLETLVIPADEPNQLKKCPIAFFTCTNTLGNSLLFSEQTDNSSTQTGEFAVPTAIGGLAGDSLHPLALGNVYTITQLLDQEQTRIAGLGGIVVIGAGGVTSKEADARMRKAGAKVVGCATFFGKMGVRAFEILGGGEQSSPL